MRLIYKEHQGISYQKYEFPYCIYAIKEPTDRYVDLYSKGFLPYTNDFSINDEIYYLARSVRIDLQQELRKVISVSGFYYRQLCTPDEWDTSTITSELVMGIRDFINSHSVRIPAISMEKAGISILKSLKKILYRV